MSGGSYDASNHLFLTKSNIFKEEISAELPQADLIARRFDGHATGILDALFVFNWRIGLVVSPNKKLTAVNVRPWENPNIANMMLPRYKLPEMKMEFNLYILDSKDLQIKNVLTGHKGTSSTWRKLISKLRLHLTIHSYHGPSFPVAINFYSPAQNRDTYGVGM